MSERSEHGTDWDQTDPKRVAEDFKGAGKEQGASLDTSETEEVDRDALHQADYGGTRDEAEGIAGARQGGVSSDNASGGGREPNVKRDRDYDPDGDRTGL